MLDQGNIENRKNVGDTALIDLNSTSNLRRLTLNHLFTPYQIKEFLPNIEEKFRDIQHRSPQLRQDILQKEIVGGHGTRSGALIPILRFGLKPTNEQKELGIPPMVGTFDWGGNNFNRFATSMIMWWNTGLLSKYTRPHAVNVANLNSWMDAYESEWNRDDLHPTRKFILSRAKEMFDFINRPGKNDFETDLTTCLLADFPVIVFGNRQSAETEGVFIPKSDIQAEYAIPGGIDPNNLPVILVSNQHLELAIQMSHKYAWSGRIGDIEEYCDLALTEH